MTEDFICYSIVRGVATIQLDSPASRNALSTQVLAELCERLDAALADAGVRVIVLTGSGTTFCAGADLRDPPGAAGPAVEPSTGRSSGSSRDASPMHRMIALLTTMRTATKPIVGRINGHARGGGVGLVAACDIAIAVGSATFAFSEVRIGVAPAMISVVVIPKIGVAQASELFLTGEAFDAQRAMRIGLLNDVVSADQLDGRIAEVAVQLRKGGPLALAACKRLVAEVPRLAPDDAFAWTAKLSADLFSSSEAAEGITAFAGRRRPAWDAEG